MDKIGVAVGMGDANYFSWMFRKAEGSSPTEYRKQWWNIEDVAKIAHLYLYNKTVKMTTQSILKLKNGTGHKSIWRVTAAGLGWILQLLLYAMQINPGG